MANSRVALFACRDSHEGVWTRARGNEFGIEIINLSDDELVRVELVSEAKSEVIEFTQPGQHLVAFNGTERYRISKQGSKNGTHVKVLLK